MKKNKITKLMLILVMALLVFSLFACGPKNTDNDGGSNTSKNPLDTPEVIVNENGLAQWSTVDGAGSYRITVYNYDGSEKETKEIAEKVYQLEEGESIEVVALPSEKYKNKYNESEKSVKKTYAPGTAKQLVNLLNGVGGIVDTWNNATDQLYADIALGGFFENETKKNSFNVFAQANASENDPEFMLGLKLNDKDYLSLGYKDLAIYVREPMNMFNDLSGSNAAPQAYKIDVTALAACIPEIMGPVMKLVKADETDLQIASLIDGATEFLSGELRTLFNILNVSDGKNGEKIISVTVSTLSLGINFIKTMLKDGGKIDEYIGYFYKVTDALKMDRIQLNGEDLSMSGILALFPTGEDDPRYDELKNNNLLNIEVSYNGADISGLNLVLDLGALGIQGLDYRFGLTIGLNTFSTTTPVTINTNGFVAKDFEINLGGILGKKNLSADAKAVIRLSDALKNKDNKWATLSIGNSLAGYIDATGAYVDFAPVFSILGNSAYAGNTKYQATYLSDGANVIEKLVTDLEANNPIAKAIDELIANMSGANNENNNNTTPDEPAQPVEPEQPAEPAPNFSIMDIIMKIANEFGAADNKVDYVCSVIYPLIMTIDAEAANFLPPEGTPITQATVIKYVFNRTLGNTGSSIAKYALFYKNGQGVAATTFEGLWTNIKACHEAGKAALITATNTTETTAGIQFFDPATPENDLLDYIAHFVKVPTISDNVPDFTKLVAINDKDNLVKWLNWIFPVENKYRVMVEDILGTGLVDVINKGIYFEAINLGGFNGAIRIAAKFDTAKNDSYVYLSAGFGMNATAAAPSGTITGGKAFNEIHVETGRYYIAEMAGDLLTALRNYGKAA